VRVGARGRRVLRGTELIGSARQRHARELLEAGSGQRLEQRQRDRGRCRIRWPCWASASRPRSRRATGIRVRCSRRGRWSAGGTTATVSSATGLRRPIPCLPCPSTSFSWGIPARSSASGGTSARRSSLRTPWSRITGRNPTRSTIDCADKKASTSSRPTISLRRADESVRRAGGAPALASAARIMKSLLTTRTSQPQASPSLRGSLHRTEFSLRPTASA
jgi:hypothetical protein